ncbi:filamentous hemagglutinin N-terminal domain-containing protein, partial [Salmonella enterica]|nr:filamentous hemagglutinin N-terminal domain-containing protein [Salmonella enterica]
MNKIYKLKFDKCRNELVVVSEITAGMGKEKSTGHIADLSALSPFRKLLGTLTPLALLTGLIISLFPGMALANPDLPTGGQIVGGQGSISTSGNQMTIHQQTQNMATNWHSFDVGQNNTVQFVQPDSSSVALNRVTGASGSQIMGTLKANGQVFILNPNGVLFGKGARVNVAGLVASTKNINTADFMKGQYTLSGSGNPGAQVVNQGSLTTSKGGYIVLAGERVSNSGTVTTPGGKTVLVAGKTVTLQLDNGGLTSVSVNGSAVNALVENRGLISATNGQVYLTAKGQDMLLNTVVNNSGTIEAKGLESRGGEIVLNGGDSGVVSQSGQLLADSQTGQGGKVILEGQNIHLAGSSLTSATGKTGGGEVYVGGGWQGKNSVIKNASKVVMDQAATVDVSATNAGNGGTAVLWSDDYTNFRGTVLAKGGARSGNGGRVETSSHNNLQAFGDVNTSASSGKGGEWLLDPMDVTIVTGSDNTNISESGKGTESKLDATTDHVFSPSASGAQVSATSIQNQLNSGTSVTVDTHGGEGTTAKGNITIANNVTITKNEGDGDATLTLLADNNIQLGSTSDGKGKNITISSTSGKLNLKLLAGASSDDDSAQVQMGQGTVNISLNDGDFTVGSAKEGGKINFLAPHADGETISAGNISITAMGTQGMNTYSLNLNASGNIDVVASNVTSGSGWDHDAKWSAGKKLTVTSEGGVSFHTDTDGSSGNTILQAADDVVITGQKGSVNITNSNKNINISSSNGSVSLSGKVQDGTAGLTLNKVNITSKDKVTLNGTTYWGQATELTGLNITAGGDVDISGTAKDDATGNVGNANTTKGLSINNSNVTSTGGNITVSGLADSGVNAALIINNSNLSANSLMVKGVAPGQGTGFSLTNTHLLGNLQNLSNVTFSSAGSGAGVINILDNSIAGNTTTRDTLFAKNIENMTSVDMNGTAIFDDTENGWNKDYTHDGKTPGWIFSNTEVKAGGDVTLKGVGFTNSTVSVTSGNLSITNTGPAPLTGTNVTVSNGSVSVHSEAGGIDLTKGNISAKNDINLMSDKGGITINNSQITSSGGNLDITGAGGRNTGVLIKASVLSGKDMNITGTTTGGYGYYSGGGGGVNLSGDVSFTVSGNGVLKATNNASGNWGLASGLAFGAGLWDTTKVTWNGNFAIEAVMKNNNYANWNNGFGAMDFLSQDVTLNFNNGISTLSANADGIAQSVFASFQTGVQSSKYVNLNNANVSLNIVGEEGGGIGMASGYNKKFTSGFIFSGKGNVSIDAKSNAPGMSAIDTNLLNNQNLTGKFDIKAVNESGTAISIIGRVGSSLVNATITGESKGSGDGVVVDALNTQTLNLNNNTISGNSQSGNGIAIKGNKVTIISGTLNGTATSGNGAGVMLSGSSNYTIDGVNVTGKSADGSGVSVGGALIVNNGTTVNGTSSGKGAGVSVAGTLTTTSGDGVSLTGKSDSGDGVQVAGNTSLTNASLDGTSVSGTGTNINGELAVSGTSDIKGTSASGIGLNIAEAVMVAETDRDKVTFTGVSTEKEGVILGSQIDGGTVTGTSTSGDGVVLAENAVVKQTTVKGSSTTGSGVNVTGGNVTLDDVTAKILTASSERGSGLTLSEGADVHVVQSGDMTTPVTTAVGLEGKSDTGSGVTVAGNAAVGGVTLKGATENGVGVTLKDGKLTLSDNLSGVEASASGNGTALVLENATVDAKGYRESEGEADANDYTLSATVTGNGTAVKTDGESVLTSVKLGATSSGNGGALVVEGTLKTDRDIAVSSSGDTGTSVVLHGGNIQATGDAPVTVTAGASGGHGTAVKVEKAESADGMVTPSSLKNIDLQASSDMGTVLDVGGELTSDKDISVSTTDGTALMLSGGGLTSADAARPVSVTASATGDAGTAVRVDKTVAMGGEQTSSSLKDIHLTTSSTKGDALNVSGRLETQNAELKASATDTGTALNISGGEIYSKGNASLTATADAGHAAVITDGKLTGEGDNALMLTASTASANPAVDISGDSDISNSSVTGDNKGTGAAVKQSGNTSLVNA